MRLAAVRLRPDQAPDPVAAHQRRPRAGAATRPRTGWPSSTSEISVAQAGTPRTKLWVPSIGSITQRRGPWPVVSNSSPSTASRGRVRLSWERTSSSADAVGVADQGEVGLGLHDEVLGAEPGHRDPLDGVRQDMGEAQVVVVGHLPTLARGPAEADGPPRGGPTAICDLRECGRGAGSPTRFRPDAAEHVPRWRKATPAEDLPSSRHRDDHVFVSGWLRCVAFTPSLPLHGCHNTNALCVTGLRSDRWAARTDRSSRTADP